MQNPILKTQTFFLTWVFCVGLATSYSPLCAAKLGDIKDMTRHKIKDLDIESSVLKKLIEREKKLSHNCKDDDQAQIHDAIARTYERIIESNEEKRNIWKALLDLE